MLLQVCSSYVRNLLPAVAGCNGDAAKSAAAAISRFSAACTCSNHRGVSVAALSCSADLVGAAVGAGRVAHSSQQQQQQAEVLVQAVLENGGIISMGIIGQSGTVQTYAACSALVFDWLFGQHCEKDLCCHAALSRAGAAKQCPTLLLTCWSCLQAACCRLTPCPGCTNPAPS